MVIDKPFVTKSGNNVIHESLFIEGMLVVIGVELDIETFEGFGNICKYFLLSLFLKRSYIFRIF